MSKYSLEHVSEGALLSGLKANLANERGSLALVLAHIGEVEAREAYKPAGYSSMHMYCVHELHLSNDAAYKRITAARLARRFPAIFEKVAEGSLCLSTVNLLAPHLTTENAEALLAETVFRTRFEVEQVLAARNPRQARPTTIEPIAQPLTISAEAADGAVVELAPGRVQEVARQPRVEPISPQLYELRLTMDQAMYEALRGAKDLLGHRQPVPDEAEILKMALGLLVTQLRKRKHGATDQPRATRRSKSARHISHDVMRRVWGRDAGQCTFVGDTGKRCPESSRLEYDHRQPVAKGGDSSVENVRLRCRAHNQLDAERVFGKPFMQHKREQARANAAAQRKQRGETENAAREARDHDEFIWWMGVFGYSAAEAEFAAAKCPPRPGQLPEMRRLECLAFLREEERLRATGT